MLMYIYIYIIEVRIIRFVLETTGIPSNIKRLIKSGAIGLRLGCLTRTFIAV